MLRTLGIVQVGASGDGLAATDRLTTIAQRRFAGKPLLEWVVRRVTDAAQLDGVIALMGRGRVCDSLVQLVPPDVPVLVSRQPDGLGVLAEAIREFPCEGAVRVSVGNPFVDPTLIDRLVITARDNAGCDYISYCRSDGRPAVLSRLGFFAEWFRGKAVTRADKRATIPADRHEATRFLCGHPELFQLRLIPIPEVLDRDDVRLTLDVEEDWEHAQAIYEALGPEALDWQRIAGLLDHHPRIRERMAILNRADD
jgi:spore coat polysaccharide biosynthesis protein SpsF (cytidylyltransferase family)